MANPLCFHLVARSLPGTLIFHDWTEAVALWRRLVKAFPDAQALCIMPNHLHLLTADPAARRKLAAVLSGFARWRAGYRGVVDATCWQPQPIPVSIPDRKHLRRTIRYVLLNPCRGGLAADPLAWPLSTHRDLVAMAVDFPAHRDPAGLHAYVSADPSVCVVGTELPAIFRGFSPAERIAAATSSVLRIPRAELMKDRFARWVFDGAARACEHTVTQIAPEVGQQRLHLYSRTKVVNLRVVRAVAAVVRAVGDDRFQGLDERPGCLRVRWDQWKQ